MDRIWEASRRSLAIGSLLFAMACGRPPGIGVGGHYLDGRMEMLSGRRGGDMDKAIQKLEYVVSRDPLYRDSLTLLGRAYYRNGLYRDAFQFLKRALLVNPRDEIGWIALGLTQLQLGEDANGLESFKGGITLLSRVSKDGYEGVEFWDRGGAVRVALRRAAFFAAKGPEEKDNIIRAGELLLRRVDQETWLGKIEEDEEKRVGY